MIFVLKCTFPASSFFKRTEVSDPNWLKYCVTASYTNFTRKIVNFIFLHIAILFWHHFYSLICFAIYHFPISWKIKFSSKIQNWKKALKQNSPAAKKLSEHQICTFLMNFSFRVKKCTSFTPCGKPPTKILLGSTAGSLVPPYNKICKCKIKFNYIKKYKFDAKFI